MTSSRMPVGWRRSGLAGAWGWVAQPGYIVVELVVAAAASAAYSLRDSTISDLGSLRCTAEVCSPWHPLMNAAFVVFSLLRVVGAVLLRRRWLPDNRWSNVAVVLWVVSGLFSAAIGFVPVDRHSGLHGIVAAPIFVTQPLAVLVTALALRGVHRWRARWGLVAGFVSIVGAVGFAVVAGSGGPAGLWERLALWPAYPWLALVGVAAVTAVSGRAPSR